MKKVVEFVRGNWFICAALAIAFMAVVLLSPSCQIEGVSVVGKTAWAWSPPANISISPGDASQRPRIAVGPGGKLHVAFMDGTLNQDTGPAYVVGQPWQPAEWIDGHSQPGYVNPAVAVDAAGTVHVVWAGLAKAPYDIFYACKPAGGAWSAPQNLSGTPSYNTVYPDLVIDASGRLWAVWQDSHSDSVAEIYVATKPAGGAWSAPTRLTYTSWQNLNARVAIDASGLPWVTWRQNGAGGVAIEVAETEDHPAGGNWEIYASRWTGSAWTAPENVSATANSSHFPAIAAGPTGVYIAWEENVNPSGDGWQIWVRRHDGSAWRPAVPASDGPKALYPNLAVDGCHVALVWVDYRSGVRSYYSESRDCSATWGEKVLVSAAVSSAYYPAVVIVGGRPHVVFQGNVPLDIWYTAGFVVAPTPTVPPTALPTVPPTPQPTVTPIPCPTCPPVPTCAPWPTCPPAGSPTPTVRPSCVPECVP